MSGYRLSTVVPDAVVPVTFDGRPLAGRAGETLAATLLANGVRTVARSFKYHRPRGIVGFGWHEPNALVQTRDGVELATRLAVKAGLEARAVNCWPSAEFDVASVLGAFGALMPAGFYYKTFRGPRGRAWHLFEPTIRALAGLGRLPEAPGPLACEKRFAHCDVLVVGGGAAGLAAATAASAAADARVWLIDEDASAGGALHDRPHAQIDGMAASDWIARTLALLRARGVRVLSRTMALGRYDGGLIVALEEAAAGGIEKRLWKIRAKAVVLATGAFERPFVFADNDRPGVMLLSAVLSYARRFSVACGREVVVVANNDEAYDDAAALAAAGIRVSALVDVRPTADPARVAAARRSRPSVRRSADCGSPRSRRRAARAIFLATPSRWPVAGHRPCICIRTRAAGLRSTRNCPLSCRPVRTKAHSVRAPATGTEASPVRLPTGVAPASPPRSRPDSTFPRRCPRRRRQPVRRVSLPAGRCRMAGAARPSSMSLPT
jgi:sarcosine oxidase subunit alpha